MSNRIELLIVGLGDREGGDGALGAAAATRLVRRHSLPEGVEVAKGDVAPAKILELISRAERVIVVDAARAGGPPGTLVRKDGAAAVDPAERSLRRHRVAQDPPRSLWPARLLFLGLVPDSVPGSAWRSVPVERGLDELVERISEEIAALPLPVAAPSPVAISAGRRDSGVAQRG